MGTSSAIYQLLNMIVSQLSEPFAKNIDVVDGKSQRDHERNNHEEASSKTLYMRMRTDFPRHS